MPVPRLSKAVASLSTAAILLSTLFAFPAAAAPDPAIDSRPVAPPSSATKPAPAAAAGRFIVKFKSGAPGTSSARAKAYGQAARTSGVSVKELRATARGASVVQATETLTPGESAGVLASLRSQSNVESAEQDTFIRPAATPNDPLYPKQWDLSEDNAGMRVPAAWDVTSGLGSIVAVIDTGIAPHSDLAQVLPGYDFISDASISNDGDGRDADATDAGDYCNGSSSSWHGTHVAGTIGATANNGAGIAGIAYSAKILPVRALGACGGYMSDIADAVVWAAGGAVSGVPANSHRANVINMSLGGAGQCSSYFQSALDFAAAQGVTVVVAAGNEDSPASGSTPANCGHVIAVGATGREGNRAYYSNYGPEVDVSAPGGDASTGGANTILSTWNNGTTVLGSETYGYMQGTSMAAPHIAGLSALIMAANPNLTPLQVEDIIKQTARPLPGTCDTGGCGAGLADAGAAVRAAAPDPQLATEPAVAGTPAIEGDAKVGSVLTANPGTWAADTQLSFQWNRAGTAVQDATGGTYTVTAADLDQTLTVTVTGTKGSESLRADSAPTPAVVRGTFDARVPVINGTPSLNYGLIASDFYETWPKGTQLTRAWYRSGVVIPGATSSIYWPKIADAGHPLTFSVTGTKDGYTAQTLVSAPTIAVPPAALPDPGFTVTGSAKVGGTLLASTSDMTWRYYVTRTWQWFRSGVALAGTNHPYYTLTAADLGKNITVRLTGARTGYATLTKDSLAFLIGPGTLSAPVPAISGTKKVGYTLTAVPGAWTAGTALKYQWYRSGVAITGATASRYTLGAYDRGKTMRVRVTGSKAGYSTVSKDSATTGTVATGTLTAGTPWIKGYPHYGYTLTANAGAWTYGTALKYQWYRSGIAIRGATARTYRLVWADRHDTIKVRVTGSKPGYSTMIRYSGSTLRIP